MVRTRDSARADTATGVQSGADPLSTLEPMSDPVRPLVVIAAVEAVAVLGVFIGVLVAALGGTDGLTGAGAGTAWVNVALWALMTLMVALILFGLYRRRAVARTPFLMVQAFVLVLVPLFWGSDLGWVRAIAVALAVLGVGGLVLGLRPSVRTSLSGRFAGPAA